MACQWVSMRKPSWATSSPRIVSMGALLIRDRMQRPFASRAPPKKNYKVALVSSPHQALLGIPKVPCANQTTQSRPGEIAFAALLLLLLLPLLPSPSCCLASLLFTLFGLFKPPPFAHALNEPHSLVADLPSRADLTNRGTTTLTSTPPIDIQTPIRIRLFSL